MVIIIIKNKIFPEKLGCGYLTKLIEVDKIFAELSGIVGEKFVSNRPEELFLYHWDFITAEKPGRCDFVVMPEKTEEVKQIVELANREKIPVVPWVSGINIGGVCIPREGGIVVDLRRMNKVLEVNEDDMYAVVEGGITWADLKGYLLKYHPDLRAGITWSPSGTGVIPAYICYGMLNLGMVGGTGAEFLNGMEVVLPNGKVVRVGSCMSTDYWYGRQPYPDLAGLFIGWEGTTGIITKAGIKLWPNLPTRHYQVIAKTVESGVDIFKKLAKAGLGIVDLCFLNYVWLTATRGVKDSEEIPSEAEKAGIHDFYGLVAISGATEKELDVKEEIFRKICSDAGEIPISLGDAVSLLPEEQIGESLVFSSPPVHLYTVWDFARGGAAEWTGGYVSSKHVADIYYKMREVAVGYGLRPQFYGRAMFGGHYWVGRMNISFSKNDPEEVEKVRKCLMDMDEEARKVGSFIRYKAPPWAKSRNFENADQNTVELMQKIKKLLDPNGIMNPGQGL